MRHVVSSGEPFQPERLAQHNGDGLTAYWDVVLIPVRGNGPPRLVVSAQDVTERAETSPSLTAENRFLRERTERESIRLEVLARIAGAAAQGGGFDAILTAIAEGVKAAFGLDTVINVLDPDSDVYVVRAGSGGGVDRLGERQPAPPVRGSTPRTRSSTSSSFRTKPRTPWDKLGNNVVMPAFQWYLQHPQDAFHQAAHDRGRTRRAVGRLTDHPAV
jgi:hypothetical protein